jgi:aminoglycoside N3'-acetyltransferase
MAEEPEIGDRPVVRFPQTLSLKDLITIVSVSIALALAWGVFGTRVSVLENDVATLKQVVSANAEVTSELSRMVERVRDQQIQHDIFIDQLYEIVKRTPPRRRGDVPQP